jgi:hypothetical protein
MTSKDLESKLTEWMVNFVEQPHPGLGNWPPCPYARQARIGNKLTVIHSAFGRLVQDVDAHLELLTQKDVIVVMFDHRQIDPDMLARLVQAYNTILMPANYVILEAHPDAQEFVNGVKMNFGLCGLLIVSELGKLNTASVQLRSKGYYDHWDQQAMNDVVNWRFR